MRGEGRIPKQGGKPFLSDTVFICNERWRKVSVSMRRIQTPWRNPACSAFLTAPTDVITGPCDPWWSDSSRASTPLPLARKQAADSERSAPPRTALLPVRTTHRIICLNCNHQKTGQKNISYCKIVQGAQLSTWYTGRGFFWWQIKRLLALGFSGNEYLVKLPGKGAELGCGTSSQITPEMAIK